MVKQSGLNIFTEINKEKRANLDSVLVSLQKKWFSHEVMPFETLGTIHFCRWIILEEMTSKKKQYPMRLVFCSNFDGDSCEQHIRDLCNHCPELFDSIYENCVGYPTGPDATMDEKIEFLIAGIVPNSVFYNSSPLRNLSRIRQEAELKNRLWEFLRKEDFAGRPAVEVKNALKDFATGQQDLVWAREREKIPGINILGSLYTILVCVALLPLLIILIIVLRIFFERKEAALGMEPGELDMKHMDILEENEDVFFHNQFSQLLIMKTHPIRRLTVNFLLWFTRSLGGFFFVKGQLMGIPTIHFARWVMFDDGEHMLFGSNFDGSWQQYLGDFIDKSGWGLTAIWSNSEGFPKTYFLFTGGAYNAEQFLAWSRYYQIPTQFWYSAYPSLSIKNVNNNSYIRDGLFQDMSEKSALAYLKRF